MRIQHHESRAALLPDLLEGLAGFAPVIINDPDPGGKVDTWAVHRLCLEAVPAGASHLLVVQDDAIPCSAFHDKVMVAVNEKPHDLLCLFTPGFGFVTRRMMEAKRLGKPYVQFPQTSFVPTVAIVYPRVIIERLLAWDAGQQWPRRRPGPLGRSDDGTVATFCKAMRIRAIATVPCLVDHDPNLPSLARVERKKGGNHRRAAVFDA